MLAAQTVRRMSANTEDTPIRPSASCLSCIPSVAENHPHWASWKPNAPPVQPSRQSFCPSHHLTRFLGSCRSARAATLGLVLVITPYSRTKVDSAALPYQSSLSTVCSRSQSSAQPSPSNLQRPATTGRAQSSIRIGLRPASCSSCLDSHLNRCRHLPSLIQYDRVAELPGSLP